MSSAVNESMKCGKCGYAFHVDDLHQESGKRKPCPKCGSTKRIYDETGHEQKIKVVVGGSATYEAHMDSKLWTIFGVILGLVIPPIFYVVFSVITIVIWYKVLIWLGLILIPLLLAYRYRIIWHKLIMFLRFFADKTYGKEKIL